MRKTLVAISLILPLVLTAGTRYKTFAYLSADKLKTGAAEETAWGNNCYVNFPIDSVTLSAIDIVILFDNQAENVLRASPWLSVIGGQADSINYFNGASQGYGGIVDAAIAKIHAAGKKILFSVTDQSDQDVNYLAQDSARCDGFGRAVAALCKRHNFDGYDINIETGFTTTGANISRFFRICKRTLDAAFSPDSSRIITIVPTPGILYPIGAEPYIDYVMPQYYGMKTAWDGNLNRGAAWPGNAYSRGPWSSAYDAGNMLDNGPQADYIAAGWPSAKLVPGIFATAYTFPGTDTIMGVLGSNYCAETANWYTRDNQLNNGLQGRYNTYTKQYEYGGTQTRATPYAGYQGPGVSAGGKVYITMPNDSTARWFAKFCDSLHLGGVMTWVVDKEMDISKPKGSGRLFTTERLQYWLSLYDGGVDPPPSGSLTATPTTLPAGGGSVTLQWTSTNATSASITPGIGNVATNGSTTTTVSSSTTFTLTLYGRGGTSTYTASVSVAAPELPPSTPSFLYPQAGALDLPTGIVLRWSRTSRATRFHLQLARDSLYTSLLVNDSTLIDTSRAVSGLAEETRYYRRVRAGNTSGWSAFSTSAAFTTMTTVSKTPDPPLLVAPVAGSTATTTSILFAWTRVAGATRYHLQVSADSLFTSTALSDTALTDTLRQVTGLAEGVSYFARVRARNGVGWGAFSGSLAFRTAAPAGPVATPTSPPNGAVQQPLILTLKWASSMPGALYDVEVALDAGFQRVVLRDSSVSNVTRTVGPLSRKTKYYWRVRGRGASGVGSFCTPWNFRTLINSPKPPKNVTIASTTAGSTPSFLLSWENPEDAEWYTVELAQDAAFAAPLLDSTVVDSSMLIPPLEHGRTYWARVRAENPGGQSGYSPSLSFALNGSGLEVYAGGTMPDDYVLSQNYPNPFNPTTLIEFWLPVGSPVSLKVYDALGREVGTLAEGTLEAGSHRFNWNAEGLSTGIYFYRLNAGAFTETRRMILVR